MICTLLIMTMIFINGIETAEQKVRRTGTGLREEEMNAKTKAWLLMVESGKVDEEELRRITPKSIFIAPLLTGNAAKCKEGYRHDHLGQCVKVIKIDPQAQLELLLKRLNTLYNEKVEEQKEERPIEASSGPLHFSIPLFNEDLKEAENKKGTTANSTAGKENTLEILPPPLPILLSNRTSPESTVSEAIQINQTKEIEASGMEPYNETEPFETSVFEGSGVSSGGAPSEIESTSIVSLLSDETDYLDVTETETTTEYQSTTEAITEMSTTSAPSEDTAYTESYQSITDAPIVNDSMVETPVESVKPPEVVRNTSQSDIIHFPSDVEVRTHHNSPVDNSYIKFPDDPSLPQPQLEPHLSYQPPPPPPPPLPPPPLPPQPQPPKWSSQFQIHPSSIPKQQFWWLPENWKVEDNQQKSSLVKFWSRLPLIHDISYSVSGNSFKPFPSHPNPHHQPNLNIRPYSHSPSHPDVIQHRRYQESPIRFSDQPIIPSRGQPFRKSRFQEVLSTGEPFRVQR